MEDVEGGLPPWSAQQKKQKTTDLQQQKAFEKVPKQELVKDSALPSPGAHSLSSNTTHFSAFSDVSASFDLTTLDCPSCRKPLQAPIFQCYNGHYECASCTNSNMSKCSKCSNPTGKIRNLGLESIINTLWMKCKFSKSGCKEVLTYFERKEHELLCTYAPHMCPILDCTFCGLLKEFLEHFTVLHGARSLELPASNTISFSLGEHDIYVVLHVKNKPMFLLHNKEDAIGNIVHLTSFCTPALNSSASWSYELNVYKGNTKLSLNGAAHSHENLMVEAKTADFLVIPKHFFDIRRYADASSDYFNLCKKVDVKICMQTEWDGSKAQS